MTMTTGELDYDAIFRLDPSGGSDDAQEIAFPPISFILWILFIVLMPVILTNMLVRTLTIFHEFIHSTKVSVSESIMCHKCVYMYEFLFIID